LETKLWSLYYLFHHCSNIVLIVKMNHVILVHLCLISIYWLNMFGWHIGIKLGSSGVHITHIYIYIYIHTAHQPLALDSGG
jgi:hypothetical protein